MKFDLLRTSGAMGRNTVPAGRLTRTCVATLLAGAMAGGGNPLCAETGPVGSPVGFETRAVLNLAGGWEAQSVDSIRFELPAPADGWKPEPVPSPNGRTALIQTIFGPYMPAPARLLDESGTAFLQQEAIGAWFRKTFTVAGGTLEGRHPVLYLDGAAYRIRIWLNGTLVGESVQCAVPLEFDLTGLLREGENELLIGLAGREALFDLEKKTYIAPSNGVNAGLRGPIEIRFLPRVHITDAFVRTRTDPNRVEIDLTVRNTSAQATEWVPSAAISRKTLNATPLLRFSGPPVAVPPGGESVVTLGAEWADPAVWDLDNPVLHVAHLTLDGADGHLQDAYQVEFGFRTFEIRGRDFYLNGRRITLFRDTCLTPLGAAWHPDQDPRSKSGGSNCTRPHLGFNNEQMLDWADRSGHLTMPEASWSWVNRFPSEHRDVWLPHTLEYYTRWIRLHRNRPSVIVWVLCNETYWDHRRPEDMAIAQVIVDHVAPLDPTRPLDGDAEVSWEGRLPILNIHYPEGSSGTLRLDYPNAGLAVPNDLEWLNPDGVSRSGRAKFEWDRPLILGEIWGVWGPPDGYSSYMGDSGYDWERWRRQDFSGRRHQSAEHFNNLRIETIKKAIDYYRRVGVAGINIWSGNRADIHPEVAVRPTDFHPNFRAGGELERGVVVFNDRAAAFAHMQVHAFLMVDGVTVADASFPSYVPPGEQLELRVKLPLPEADRVTAARLTVRLRWWAGGSMHEFNRFEEDVFIVPAPSIDPEALPLVALYDPDGRTEAALERAGLALPAVEDLDAETLARVRLVILGENAFRAELVARLDDFAERGGRVLILRQEGWQPWRTELPERDREHAATQGWIRGEHPVLAGMFEGQFSFWRPDNVISRETFWKPSVGRMRSLLDCGGRYGMRWTPLLSVRLKAGEILLTTLPLVDGLEVEPAAGWLLANVIRASAAAPAAPAAAVPLNLVMGENPDLRSALTLVGAVTAEGVGEEGPVLVNASAGMTPQRLDALRGALGAGRTVWLHGFDDDTLPSVAPLFPFEPLLEAPDPTVQSAVLRVPSPISEGLSNFDFYWTRVNLGARADFFQEGQPTVPLGDRVLRLPLVGGARKLIEPGFLAEIPVGAGRILFDTLPWERAFSAETDKASRLVSTLIANLGGDLRMQSEPNYDYFHVDLAPFANMGYYDPVAGDGQGGWTDQGRNDMRFFLINHTGRAGGEDDAYEVPVDEFPARVRLGQRPWRLADPSANEGRAVISFRSTDRAAFLPDRVEGIPVGARADRLWFLHAAAWANLPVNTVIAEYVVRYEDETTEIIPVRNGMEIGDWWNPTPMSGAEVAWTGRNLMHAPVGIWSMHWENPRPDRVIRSIDVRAALSPAQLVLLGITGGVLSGGEHREALAARWDMTRFADGKVLNLMGAPEALNAGTEAPVLVEDQGLRFHGQADLRTHTDRLPGFEGRWPASLVCDITLDGPPDGYYAGVFQATGSGTGFRLLVRKGDMRVVVEASLGADERRGLIGKTRIIPGRRHRLEVRFEGGRSLLYVDGRLEDAFDGYPALFQGLVLIGRASGQGYGLNGILHGIEVRSPRTPETADEQP